MPIIIRPDGDTDLSNATITAETALPQTISGLTPGDYEVGRVEWASAVTVTAPADVTAPTLQSVSETGGVITLTFSEPVVFAGGAFRIFRVDTAATVETFGATGGNSGAGGTLSVAGAVVTMTPGNALVAGTDYAIRWTAAAVEDAAGNDVAAVADSSFTFTTAAGGATPATILGADLIEYFDMSTVATLRQTTAGATAVVAGDPVGWVEGQSAAFNLVAPADDTTRPTARAGYIEFDGANDRLRAALARSGAIYTAMRMRLPVAPTGNEYLTTYSQTEGGMWWSTAIALLDSAPGGGTILHEGGGGGIVPARATWLTLEWVVDTDQRDVQIDGAGGTNADTYAPPATSFVSIGGTSAPDQWLQIDIAKMVLADIVPSAGQRTDLRAWLEA